MNQVQSQLARYVAKPSLSEGQLLALGARAYHDHKILVVRLSQLDNPIDQQMVKTIADNLFGRRENHGV